MTKAEIRKRSEIRTPNPLLRTRTFGLRDMGFLRHSTFVIRHCILLTPSAPNSSNKKGRSHHVLLAAIVGGTRFVSNAFHPAEYVPKPSSNDESTELFN